MSGLHIVSDPEAQEMYLLNNSVGGEWDIDLLLHTRTATTDVLKRLVALADDDPEYGHPWFSTLNNVEEEVCFGCRVQFGDYTADGDWVNAWKHEPDCVAVAIDELLVQLRGDPT